MSKESGQQFIANLKSAIDKIEIYSPTGKYGKAKLDRFATAKEKMERLMLASPSDPDEILEYVFFCKSLGGDKSNRVMKHLCTIIERAKIEYPNDATLKIAASLVRKIKNRQAFDLLWRIVVLLLGIAIYVWGFTTDWHWAWKIVWALGMLFPMALPAIPLINHDGNDRNNLFY